mmetsp:Transcript_7250/g.7334  ORF Transcript_7250/g.7334 Transcript_7250/m.7334 type:complete len:288 (+) Transcript_7250:368-1231(+)
MSIGYENTPITQIISALILILGWLFGSSKFITLELFKLGELQLWRIITSQLIFENLAQTAVGLMLLYSFRQFERQMGSKKFAFFVFISSIITQFNVISVEIFALSMDFDFVPASGPYFLIFSLLAIFYSRVPKLKSSEYRVFGFGFSEKSWVYLLAAQLLFSGGLRSTIPAFSGYLVGYMYNEDYCSVQRFRFPRIIENAFSFVGNLFLSIIPVSAPPTVPGIGRDMGLGVGGRAGLGGANGITAPSPPSEQTIQTLMNMGFDRAAVIRALQSTDNNMDAALNILLQ